MMTLTSSNSSETSGGSSPLPAHRNEEWGTTTASGRSCLAPDAGDRTSIHSVCRIRRSFCIERLPPLIISTTLAPANWSFR